MSYEAWNVISRVAFALAILGIGISLYLFIHDGIWETIGILSGRRARREVKRMKQQKEGNKRSKRSDARIEQDDVTTVIADEGEGLTRVLEAGEDNLTTLLRMFIICGMIFMLSSQTVMASSDDGSEDSENYSLVDGEEYPQADCTLSQNCVVRVQVYMLLDGEEQLLREGRGILIGGDASCSTHLITCQNLVNVSDEDIAAMSSDEGGNVVEQIYILIGQDIRIPVSVELSSTDMDLSILKLGQTIYDRPAAILGDGDAEGNDLDEIYILYDADGSAVKRNVSAFFQDAGINWIQYDGESVPGGCAVIDGNGEVVAMTVESPTKSSMAVYIGDIESVLRTLGIAYLEAKESIPETDKSALRTAVDMMDVNDSESYTEESLNLYIQAMDNARMVLESSGSTQADVDEAYTMLVTARNGLVRQEHVSPLIIVLFVLIIVILVIMLTVAVVYLYRRKKAKKIEEHIKETESKKAPKEYAPFLPSYIRKSDMDNGMKKVKVDEMAGFAPSREKTVLNTEDTVVLSSYTGDDDIPTTVLNDSGMMAKAYLFYANRDDEIALPEKTCILGKGKNADIRVDNTAVSREHISIEYTGGCWFATDLGTTNGTYIDGQKLRANQKYELADGMQLRLADEEFVFRISRK